MENIFVIRRHKYGTYLVHRKLILHETLNWMNELGLSISPQEKVCCLTKTEQYLVEILKAYIPVSYTHLDVYKRQLQTR